MAEGKTGKDSPKVPGKSAAKDSTKGSPKDEKPDKPSEIKRELTDEEIEAVAGGGIGILKCPE